MAIDAQTNATQISQNIPVFVFYTIDWYRLFQHEKLIEPERFVLISITSEAVSFFDFLV